MAKITKQNKTKQSLLVKDYWCDNNFCTLILHARNVKVSETIKADLDKELANPNRVGVVPDSEVLFIPSSSFKAILRNLCKDKILIEC